MVAEAIHKYKRKEYAGTEKLITKGIKYMKDFQDANVEIGRQEFLKEVVAFQDKFNKYLHPITYHQPESDIFIESV